MNVEYFLLALSGNNVRLYLVKNFVAEEVKSNLLPKDMDEALHFDTPELSVQHHSVKASHGSSPRSAVFHGQGSLKDDKKIDLEKYLRIVNRQLNKVLQGKTKPLVLACVDYLFPMYKKVNTYPLLLDNFVSGNPDNLPATTLVQKSRGIVNSRL